MEEVTDPVLVQNVSYFFFGFPFPPRPLPGCPSSTRWTSSSKRISTRQPALPSPFWRTNQGPPLSSPAAASPRASSSSRRHPSPHPPPLHLVR